MRGVIVLFVFFVFVGCKSNKPVVKSNNDLGTEFTPQYTTGPRTLVYKTKKDYSNLVPVLLSDDKTEIISYPHPTDLKVGGSYPLPTFLNNGYLLDNRGIGKNVAFLKLSYQEYAELKNLPTLTELYSYIVDKDPLTELCDCGNRAVFTNIVAQLNDLVGKKKLRITCKTIK